MLLADEPVSALDVTTRIQIIDLLGRAGRDAGHDGGHGLARPQRRRGAVPAHRRAARRRIVEQGDDAEVLGAPSEAYTRRLLASVPRLPRLRRERAWMTSSFVQPRLPSHVHTTRRQSSTEKTADVHFEGGMRLVAATGSGHQIVMDDSNGDSGAQPTELLLAALGGCTGMDVVSILRKKGQEVTRFDVRVRRRSEPSTRRSSRTSR